MTKITVHIAAFVSMFFWGISYVWSKVVFEYYTPLTTIFIRLLISVLVLFLFMFLSRDFQTIKRKHIWLFIVSTLFNPFLYFVGESHGLQQVSVSTSAFIIATIPVFTPFLAYWFLREKLNTINLFGLLVSFAGVLFIIIKPDFTMAASPWGITLLFMAVFSAVIYAVLLKKLLENYKPVTIIAWQSLIGLLYFLPFFLLLDADSFLSIHPSTNASLSLIMLGIFASSLAYVLYTYAVKSLGVIQTNIYINLIPVFAAVTAFFVLDEIFTSIKITGMVLVIFGVVLSQITIWGKKKNA